MKNSKYFYIVFNSSIDIFENLTPIEVGRMNFMIGAVIFFKEEIAIDYCNEKGKDYSYVKVKQILFPAIKKVIEIRKNLSIYDIK